MIHIDTAMDPHPKENACKESIGLLQKLKYLNVSGNKLCALPDSISLCRCVQESTPLFSKLYFDKWNCWEIFRILRKVLTIYIISTSCNLQNCPHILENISQNLKPSFYFCTCVQAVNVVLTMIDWTIFMLYDHDQVIGRARCRL